MQFILRMPKCIMLVLLFFCLTTKGHCQSKVFKLDNYGAVQGGKVDNSKALLKAWNDACKWKGGSKLIVSPGTYLVSSAVLTGPCNGPIEFRNTGILKAPLGQTGGYWIEFRNIDGLVVRGGGSFIGAGPPKQPSPNSLLLRFSFVTNSKAENIKLINSLGTHFNLFGCNNVKLNRVTVSSPEDSPNTDGIKIGNSNNIKISNSHVASGDDCIAILTGSKNINVTRLACGPGHGISIGSMGGSPNERVEDIFVRNSNLTGTTNGLRIKTKATNLIGIVNKVRYENIFMEGVENPIIFDQNYCPPRNCGKGISRVQIRDVKFKNIHGTSRTIVAVNLQCSVTNPCDNLEFRDINLKYEYNNAGTLSNCSYANGMAYGKQVPKSCLL